MNQLSHSALFLSMIWTFSFSSEELPSATVLNGLQLDLSGMIGSALSGALISPGK
jgi:hypothetical protein